MKTLRAIVLVIATVVVSLVLFLALLDIVVMPLLVDVDSVQVPDLRKRGLAEAEAHLKRIGLRVAQADGVYDDRLPVGTIVGQKPEPRKYIKKGRRVFVQVSKGERLYEVPNLMGVGERDAGLQLQTQKLNIGQISYVSSASAPKGSVISLRPGAGSRLHIGQSVDLDISSGSPLDPKTVPSLLGRDIGVVEDVLSRYEMRLGQINHRLDLGSAAGTVLLQDPPAGSKRMRNTKINLVLSAGRAQ
jgi:beta-lactam-binding protein with PASTA domain